MVVVEWRPQARADLLEIIDYISDDNPVAAPELKDEIEEKACTLAEHPELYKPGRVANTREMVLRRNYIVVYAVNTDHLLPLLLRVPVA